MANVKLNRGDNVTLVLQSGSKRLQTVAGTQFGGLQSATLSRGGSSVGSQSNTSPYPQSITVAGFQVELQGDVYSGTGGFDSVRAKITSPSTATTGVYGLTANIRYQDEIHSGTDAFSLPSDNAFYIDCLDFTLDVHRYLKSGVVNSDGTTTTKHKFSATATPTGGTAPYSYSWTLPSDAENVDFSGDNHIAYFEFTRNSADWPTGGSAGGSGSYQSGSGSGAASTFDGWGSVSVSVTDSTSPACSGSATQNRATDDTGGGGTGTGGGSGGSSGGGGGSGGGSGSGGGGGSGSGSGSAGGSGSGSGNSGVIGSGSGSGSGSGGSGSGGSGSGGSGGSGSGAGSGSGSDAGSGSGGSGSGAGSGSGSGAGSGGSGSSSGSGTSGGSGSGGSGSGGSGGSGSGGPAPCNGTCVPAVTCNATLAIQSPASGQTVGGIVEVRVQMTDANEVTDKTSANYCRACNATPPPWTLKLDGNALEILSARLVSGTPRNGVWALRFDARDHFNGSRSLGVMTRAVGCCIVATSRAFTLSNNANRGTLYRDFDLTVPQEGMSVADAVFGVEVPAVEVNTARRFWAQWRARSGTALDGTYLDSDWLDKHQGVATTRGQHWDASGQRFERTQHNAHIRFKAPLSPTVRVRERWVPQFYQSCFPTGCGSVVKIREAAPGAHFVFGVNPAKAFLYDGETLRLVCDLATQSATNATDAAGLDDKLWVLSDTTLFVYDGDAGQSALNISIRGETRTPKFVETIIGTTNGKPDSRVLGLFVSGTDTRCYDLTFQSPKPLWTLAGVATKTFLQKGVSAPSLLIAVGASLYVSIGGTATPALVYTFPANITSADDGIVGLANGHLYQLAGTTWTDALTLPAPVGGALRWQGGLTGETNTQNARTIAGGGSNLLRGQRPSGAWMDEVTFQVPTGVTGSVGAVSALGLYRKESKSTDAAGTTTTTADERVLVGTSPSGLLFVYQRSALSEADGAVLVSHTTGQRLLPLRRQVATTN